MLNTLQMKDQVKNYDLYFDEEEKQVMLLKKSGQVNLSYNRAIEWVLEGITDLDCRTKQEMLTLINSWKLSQ